MADEVERLLPGARVVVSFRDPVDRCWSWYRFVRSTARIPKEMGFADYVDRCEQLHREGVDGQRINQPFWGLGGGCYDTWFDAWSAVFGERLRVEFFEVIVRDPQAVVVQLCEWLGIDTAVCAELRYGVENKTVQYRNKRIQQAALALNRRGERFFASHPDLKRVLRGAYYKVNSEDAPARMDPDVRERLEVFYAPHNKRLAGRLADDAVMTELPGLAGAPQPGVSVPRPSPGRVTGPRRDAGRRAALARRTHRRPPVEGTADRPAPKRPEPPREQPRRLPRRLHQFQDEGQGIRPRRDGVGLGPADGRRVAPRVSPP